MKFSQPGSEVWIPASAFSSSSPGAGSWPASTEGDFAASGSNDVVSKRATQQVTHLGVGAHADDLELLAVHGILECFRQEDGAFAGAVVTDGVGSVRPPDYAHLSDAEMRICRKKEQKKAALLGEYSSLVFLDHSSQAVRSGVRAVRDDLRALVRATRPEVLYTHCLTDLHETHVAVALQLLFAIRELAVEERPSRVIGCEVWGDLDWLPPHRRIEMDVSSRPHLQAALLGTFDSQLADGKRYDRAALGRRRAHATFGRSDALDRHTGVVYGMDLTPLVKDDSISVSEFVQSLLDDFGRDVMDRLQRRL